ncbi:peptidase S41 [Candidatus Gracilibacteria bacterium]|nr:peptidase S41 [Candidatus Gracilibacteria bacterium]
MSLRFITYALLTHLLIVGLGGQAAREPGRDLVPVVFPSVSSTQPQPFDAQQGRALFAETWAIVRDYYVDPNLNGVDWAAVPAEFLPQIATITDKDAFYWLMWDVIDRLGDEHSTFLAPVEALEEDAFSSGESSGVFLGFGLHTFAMPDGSDLIQQVQAGSPAAQAGLQTNDLIITINDLTPDEFWWSDYTLDSTTAVRFEVQSPNGAPRMVPIVPAEIDELPMATVSATRIIDGRVGFIVIYHFDQEGSSDEIRAALRDLLAEGPLEALVIDVRLNGGGYIIEMQDTLGLFIDGGIAGRDTGRDFADELPISSNRLIDELRAVPIAILAGPETVSAADVFSAVMQHYQRAVVVGLPTAGNTESLLPYELSDGSRIWLANSFFALPDGTALEGRGVTPDRTFDVAWWRYAPEEDPLVLAALDMVR